MKFRTRLKGVLFAAGLSLSAAAAASTPDGPYVLRNAAGGWDAVSAQDGEGGRKTATPLKSDASVTIAAVGEVPAFQVRLRAPASDATDAVRTSPNAPLFVVADTHGEYEILVSMLRAHGIIGPRLEWKFARGHLVVLGDVFDRGPNHLEILWLLYRLEAEAAKAGGGAHLVLGNHEAMVLGGDLRYLNDRYVTSARVLGVASYSDLFAADSLLGQWLRSRTAMLRINDYLCMHAGVSRALVDSSLILAEVNGAVRAALRGAAAQDGITQLVMGSLGPLWYRGYFAEHKDFPTATMEDVDLALKHFGARRILIGHTIVPTVTPLYEGKVIAVQVYPRRDDRGHANFQALLIRNGELRQARLDGTSELLIRPARD
jgi:hypothetical protein